MIIYWRLLAEEKKCKLRLNDVIPPDAFSINVCCKNLRKIPTHLNSLFQSNGKLRDFFEKSFLWIEWYAKVKQFLCCVNKIVVIWRKFLLSKCVKIKSMHLIEARVCHHCLIFGSFEYVILWSRQIQKLYIILKWHKK